MTRAHSGHGVDHGPDDRVILFFRLRHMRGAFTFERGFLTMPKLSPEEIKKLKEERKRAEWWEIIRRLFSMALFHAAFGRDQRK